MIVRNKQTIYTLLKSLAGGAAIAAGLLFTPHRDWACGFMIGAFLSLFSLVSLKLFVPVLFYPGASSRASFLLTLTLMLKLPLYAVALYAAARLGRPASIAAFVGCTLVPGVITLEALGKIVIDEAKRREQKTFPGPSTVQPMVVELMRQAAEVKAQAAAGGDEIAPNGAVSSHTRPVREGVS